MTLGEKMLMNQTDYLATIQEIKAEIKKAQYQATVKVNHELLLTYYHIGQGINRHKVWGGHVHRAPIP